LNASLKNVDMRTRLAGNNRLELLLFGLGPRQRFGINVFKVQEVIRRPELILIPHAPPKMAGIANIRGQTISFIDLAIAVGMAQPSSDTGHGFAIITEFNRSTHGFLVSSVDRIINLPWEEVQTPPMNNYLASYITAIAHFEQDLITIIDVEKILQEFETQDLEITADLKQHLPKPDPDRKILIVDDSVVARQQIKKVVEQLGHAYLMAKTGKEALSLLEQMAEESGQPVSERLSMVISDIEMPEMDGYTLTTRIRQHPLLKSLYVMLHTSLSGQFNQAMVAKVGANCFLAKFHPDDLAKAIIERFDQG